MCRWMNKTGVIYEKKNGDAIFLPIVSRTDARTHAQNIVVTKSKIFYDDGKFTAFRDIELPEALLV